MTREETLEFNHRNFVKQAALDLLSLLEPTGALAHSELKRYEDVLAHLTNAVEREHLAAVQQATAGDPHQMDLPLKSSEMADRPWE